MFWDQLDGSIWNVIIERPTSNREFVAGEPITGHLENSVQAYIFISTDGTYHLLISTDDTSDDDLYNPHAAGLNVTILRNHIISGVPRQDYIDIFCSGRHHAEPFTEIVKEICRNIFERHQNSVEAVNNIIRKWKSFWGKPPGALLGIEEQVGLIGELFILEHLVIQNYANSIESWTNAINLSHDFEFDNVSLEIKTTRHNHHRHIINGLDQLEPTPSRSLILISIIALESEDGISLADMIHRIDQLLQNQPNHYDLFLDKIFNRGYRPEHETVYNQNHFRITEVRSYSVTEQFPKLVHSSLNQPPTERISNIRYSLDLEGLEYATLDTINIL